MQNYLRLTLIIYLICLTIPVAGQGAKDPFVGTFAGSGLTLTLTGQNGQYTGSSFYEGQTMQVSAQKSGAGLISGYYVLQGVSLPFQARLQGNTLTLSAGGVVYSLTRQTGSAGPSGSIKNDEWGMRFTTPSGWVARLTDSGYLLGSNTVKGALLLLPSEATSFDELRAGAHEGINEAGGTQLRLTGEIKPFGKNGLAAYYEGTLQWKKAKAYAIGLLSPHGIGAIVMAVVETQSYTPEHTKAAEALARSIRFYKPPVSPMVLEWKQKLSGCRLSYFSRYSSGGSGYTSAKTIDFCAQGFFRYGLKDETVWNAGSGTVTGGYAMNHGKGSGTWKVVAQNGEPFLQLNYYDGKVASYQLSKDGKGRTYLDGDRYLRTCDPNDQVVDARPNCW